MNYRHAFHAGNFADVCKHAVLARIIHYLRSKEKPFRVIDTHAGPGAYDLGSAEAVRGAEWPDGIGRLMGAKLPPEAAALLEPYLAVVQGMNGGGRPGTYPGSPLLARRLLRRQDRLTAVELHREDAAALKELFAGDVQVRVIALDGWLALGAQVPPKEKRGLVLVDPPFEEADDWRRLVEGLVHAYRRWPGGIYALWYPVKNRDTVSRFRERLRESGVPKILDMALETGAAEGLAGSGMVVVNPPFTLEGELRVLLPALQSVLGRGRNATSRVEWLAGEASPREGADAWS
jgi:23S rRNA (adenine2030-N6)-methyltransferase